MPIQQPPNPQFCTYDTAADLAGRLRDIGVSVDTIYEIDATGKKNDTTADNYYSDGLQYQYVAQIWGGPEQSLAVTDAMFKQKGYNVGTFTQLATAAQVPNVDTAIMALHGVSRGVNAVLTKQME
jgi:hypothetical protein